MANIETIVIDDDNDAIQVLSSIPITPPPSKPQIAKTQPPQTPHRTSSIQSASSNGSGGSSKRRKVTQVTDPRLLGASIWSFDAKVKSREHTLSIDTDGRGVSPASMPEQPDTPTPSQRPKRIKMVYTDFQDSGLGTSSSLLQAKCGQKEIQKRDSEERVRFAANGLQIFHTNDNHPKARQSNHALRVNSSSKPSALTERPRNSLKFGANGIQLPRAPSTPTIHRNQNRESRGDSVNRAITSAFNISQLDGQYRDTSDLSGERRRSSALSSIYETLYGWQRSSSIARQAAGISIPGPVKHLSIHNDSPPRKGRENEAQSSSHTFRPSRVSLTRTGSLAVLGERKRVGLSLSRPIVLDYGSEWDTDKEERQLNRTNSEVVGLDYGSPGSIVRSVETDEDEVVDVSGEGNGSPNGTAGSGPEDMESDFDMCVVEDNGFRIPSTSKKSSRGVNDCGTSFSGAHSNRGRPEFSTPPRDLLRKASRNTVGRNIAKHIGHKAPNILKSHNHNLFIISSDTDDAIFSGDESQTEVLTPSSSGRKRKRGDSDSSIDDSGDSTFTPSSDAEGNSSATTEESVELLDDDSDEENDEVLQEMKMEEMMGDMGLSDDEVEDVTPRRKPSVIDLESQIESAMSDDEVEFLREREVQKAAEKSRRSAMAPLRNLPIVHPLVELESYVHHHKLERGTFIEVGHLDPTDMTFLLVKHIVMDTATGQITMRGHEFRRIRMMHGVIERKINELCRILVVDQDDSRPWAEQGMIELPVEHVMTDKPPRELVVTNRVFGEQRGGVTWRQAPKCRGWNEMRKRERERWIEKSGLLSARWEQVTIWQDGRSRIDMRETVPSRIYRLISEDDEDIKGRYSKYSSKLMREDWRGEGATVRGGGWWIGVPQQPQGYFTFDNKGQVVKVLRRPSTSFRRGSKYIQATTTYEIDLTDDDQSPRSRTLRCTGSYHRHLTASLTQTMSIDLTTSIDDIPPDGKIQAGGSHARFSISRGSQGNIKRRPGQMYTYGDSFCGAGGATRGAQMAGLKVLFGFDKWNTACESWHMNFPQAATYEMDAHEFSTSPHVLHRYCDILHMSPPCQYFSPAHTVEGKDDETNSAALFSCSEILKACRPRLATLEQTYGITHGEFRHWFNHLINQFTENGYSVVYKICKLERWGLPQRRRRLIIIAAAPGEKLPPIPEYTHIAVPSSEHPNFLPLASLKSACSRIPNNALNHNPQDPNLHFSHRHKPWDGDSICPRAMTTHGGFNYHWDGLRKFTLREFACIQGFPVEHRFANVHVMRLIGNAVPPLVAKVLFEQCRRSLEGSDGVEKEVVEIDD